MILQKDLQKLFQKLVQADSVHFKVDGTDILIRVFDHASKLFLSAPVFSGDNFIPKSVRKCLSETVPFGHSDLKTYFTVDEEHFQVVLNYVGLLDSMGNMENENLKEQLEDFSLLAEKWHEYLEDHGKSDLVYVWAKK